MIVGPTAAGKTAKALTLAAELNNHVEVISADSRHVYRRMDIGTNKPTADEQAQVHHHLLDLREPYESFSLAEYVKLARATMDEIQSCGKTPMFVGGTGQYIRAVLEGWQVPEVPPDENIRARWLAFEQTHGQDELFGELVKLDPVSANSIDKRNIRRVIRALEVMEVTGARWSDLQRRDPIKQDVQMIYVNLPREQLYALADARIERMIQHGWLEECDALLNYLSAQGFDFDAALALPSMSSLGYRELCAVVHGQKTIEQAVIEIKHATRRFIRMQDAWFRRSEREARG